MKKKKKGGFWAEVKKILSFGLVVAKASSDADQIRGGFGATLKNMDKKDLPKL